MLPGYDAIEMVYMTCINPNPKPNKQEKKQEESHCGYCSDTEMFLVTDSCLLSCLCTFNSHSSCCVRSWF